MYIFCLSIIQEFFIHWFNSQGKRQESWWARKSSLHGQRCRSPGMFRWSLSLHGTEDRGTQTPGCPESKKEICNQWNNFGVKSTYCCSNVETEYCEINLSVMNPFSCLLTKMNNTVNSCIPYILPVCMSIWGPHMMSLVKLSVWIFCCPNDLQNFYLTINTGASK